ncbi:MAG: tyrosine-type recombinase/integrase, partial [Sulfurimonas sp.]|nr:tyrosine-type recombinase/integrase [Sulfurimonas sp.]
PNGSKLWRIRYTFESKVYQKSLGKFPSVSLNDAREQRDLIKDALRDGIDPFAGREPNHREVNSFKELCNVYFEFRSDLSIKYVKDCKATLENYYYPTIGTRYLNDLKPIHIITILHKMNRLDKSALGYKTGSMLHRVFKYAVTFQIMERNPMNNIDLSVLLKPRRSVNYPHIIEEDALRDLILAIDKYDGFESTRLALQFSSYTFVRPSNVRFALWSEMNFDKKIWVIPATKMKMKRDHIVPLTDSMLKILKQTKELGESKYCFPSARSKDAPLSQNTLNSALQRMGYKGIMTAHGFRHTASTFLHENISAHGVLSDAIEMQLAHVEKNTVKGIYNKALYLVERRKLMEWWSAFLDFQRM